MKRKQKKPIPTPVPIPTKPSGDVIYKGPMPLPDMLSMMFASLVNWLRRKLKA